jgi:hypothetical protein
MTSVLATGLLALAGVLAAPPAAPKFPGADVAPPVTKAADGSTLLELHQLVCVFQEGEPDALPYTAKTPAECERVNRASADKRKKAFKRLRIRAGKYTLRVVNTNVPWPTAFDLRGERDVALPTAVASEIQPGTGKEIKVTLEPGQYVYTDPVSKTATYELLVER